MQAAPLSLSDHSRFVQRIHRRYASVMHHLPPGVPQRSSMQRGLTALHATGLETGAALRVLRQLVIERLVVLDCGDGAAAPSPALPLSSVMRAMTDLAELALDVAMKISSEMLESRHGIPQPLATGATSGPARMWVVGMGKLGARELNVSSDIDLIYVYDYDGETTGNANGRGKISNHEYFAQQVKAVFALIGETTEHGFVFRVDLALRPHGNSGPAAVSLAALDAYFQAQGREWERFAWLKSRVVAPQATVTDTSAHALRGSVLPFVFRRYLDYSVFEALRVLHRQIRDHAAKRAAGHPERANDVKLSRGGIREIEFTVQLLQVVRGGQFPELRTRPTTSALHRVAQAGLMPVDTAEALAEAYDFLRRTEHRIQYLDDQQTHALPTADADLDWIAQTLGFASSSEFLHQLDTHRERVAGEFDRLLGNSAPAINGEGAGAGSTTTCRGKQCAPPTDQSTHAERAAYALAAATAVAGPENLDELLAQLSSEWPPEFRARLGAWRSHPRVQGLRQDSRIRLVRIVQRTAQWMQEGSASEAAGVRLLDWIEPLLRRESYLALLLERPSVHERLLRLLGAARWPARYLLQHPGVIDELADNRMLQERFDASAFTNELQLRLASLVYTGEDDEETCLNLLRRAHHAEVFRTLARDVEGVLPVEQVADDLSALAETVLRITAQWCWQRLRLRGPLAEAAQPFLSSAPAFAIVAYGKLGGKELGYGSDLDIVFIYDVPETSSQESTSWQDQAPEIYGAFVRKLIGWLTLKTSEGDLFEIDTALRPNGNSGLLVSSFEAFSRYQQQRGSNTAWTWEHQAMTRARFLDMAPTHAATTADSLQQRFENVRLGVVTAVRDVALLKAEIVGMRAKVRAAHPVKGEKAGLRFDVKHSPGGMVDAEFAVQFLVLAYAGLHAALQANVGNIALLQRAEEAGLLPPAVGQKAANAYRELRREQHRARLNEEPTQVVPPAFAAEREAVLAVWRWVFEREA